jgi:prephenate dehydrogenase
VAAVEELASSCGAVPLRIEPEAHDRAVALLSHLPQLVSSALAGLLDPANGLAAGQVALSGPGLADTTRLAASDPQMWVDVLIANADHLLEPLALLGRTLGHLSAALAGLADSGGEASARAALRDFLSAGNRGRALVPVKHGRLSEDFVGVRVDVADEPGRLAALLADAAQAGVNVEDLRVEHVPGRPRGIIELLIAAPEAPVLADALSASGWLVVR